MMLTVTEAAQYLSERGYKCDRSRVHRLIKSGDIPAARIGHVYRIDPVTLDGMLTPKVQKVEASA